MTGRRASGWRSRVRRRVVVNLKSGTAVVGVLFETRGSLLVLRDASVVTHGKTAPADGEIVVDVAEVDYAQVVPPTVPS